VDQPTEKASVITGGSQRLRVAASRRRRFSTHVAWTLIARLVMLAGGMGASVIVARWLGVDGLGALAVINVTVAVALQLGSGGLPSSNTYFIAQNRRSLGSVWTNSLIFALAAGGVLALLVTALAMARPALFGHVPLRLLVAASVSIPFQLITLFGLNVFLGLERVGQFNLLDAAAQLLILLNALVALVILGLGLWTLVTLNVATAILLSLVIAWMIGRVIKEQGDGLSFRPDAQLFKRMARFGLKFHIPVVAGILIFRADLLIVNHFRGPAEAGVYAVASQVGSLLMLLPGVIGTLLFPRVASDGDARGEFTMRVTRHTAFVMLIICLLAAPAAFLLPLLYGAPFTDATVQLLILLPGIYLIGIESVLVQHFSGLGLPPAIPVFWLVTLAVNVLLNLLLVPTYGARAAALASTVSYAMIFVMVVFYFQLKTGNHLTKTLLLGGKELRALLTMARGGVSSR
jgi:O-antigen/teichoic acid export membrane protein